MQLVKPMGTKLYRSGTPDGSIHSEQGATGAQTLGAYLLSPEALAATLFNSGDENGRAESSHG